MKPVRPNAPLRLHRRRLLTSLLAVTATGAALTGCGTRLGHSEIIGAGGGSTVGGVLNPAGSQGLVPGATGDVTGGGSTAVGGAPVAGGAVDTAPGAGPASGASTGSGTSTSVGAAAGGSTTSTAGSGASTSTAGASGDSGGTTAASASLTAAQAVATLPIFGGNAAGCKPASGSAVELGNVSTTSGILGQLFYPAIPALQTFVKAQNACGGLSGHKIKITFEDDQGDPSTATSAAQDLIQNRHILAFVGDIQPLTIDAMTSTIRKSGIPLIGGDITNNTYFSSPLIFPMGPPAQAMSAAILDMQAKEGNKLVGDLYCLEVPQACAQIDQGIKDLAPKFNVKLVSSSQVSITAPSYTSQFLDAQKAGATSLSLMFDAPTMHRVADSCDKVGFHPKWIAYSLGVGNESLFFGNKNLGNTRVPIQTFPWMAHDTPAEKFYQAAVAKYNPGVTTGAAASDGWTSAALLVAAASHLSDKPTTKDMLDQLYSFKGQPFTNLAGLSAAPLTFNRTGTPTAPYCYFSATINSANTDWASSISKPTCTNVVAPNAPA